MTYSEVLKNLPVGRKVEIHTNSAIIEGKMLSVDDNLLCLEDSRVKTKTPVSLYDCLVSKESNNKAYIKHEDILFLLSAKS